jgi:predicted CXXCH cytochrome family protein
MMFLHAKHKPVLFGILLLLCGAVLFSACEPLSTKKRRFVRKECLDCHKEFAEQYLTVKNVHPVVKERKCETCHLRHGMVPKLLLKKKGNEVCYECHSREDIGMNKPKVHTGLKKGKCTLCHNPHASQADSPMPLMKTTF